MKVMRNVLLAGCSVFLLTQCASQDEIRKLNYQIRSVNQKVEEVKANTVNQMQKRQASSVNKIDAVEGETQQLRALIDESNHNTSQLREQTQGEIAALQSSLDQIRQDYNQRVEALELKVSQLSETLVRAQQARVMAAEQKAREAARRAEEARRRTVVAVEASDNSKYITVRPGMKKRRISNSRVVDGTSASSVKTTTAAAVVQPSAVEENVETVVTPQATGNDKFSRAMQSYEAGKYKEAYQGFEQVLSQNPQGASAAQTLFYMGECLYNQHEYDLAILDYQKVISNHAGDSHTPSAMLKQGMAFEKLTDHETAKIIYKKLLADYPDSSESSLAEQRLNNL